MVTRSPLPLTLWPSAVKGGWPFVELRWVGVPLWLVRWLIIGQLFLVFLQTRMSRSSLRRSHFILLAVNVAMGFAAWQLGKLVGGRDVGQAAFFGGITPTASAAPVIMSFLHGRVEYVIASFVLTNVVIAALMPLLLPLVLGRPTPEAFGQVSGSIGFIVFGPMIAAQLLRLAWPGSVAWPPRLRNVSFGCWATMMFLVTANASDFIRHESTSSHHQVLLIAVVTAGVSPSATPAANCASEKPSCASSPPSSASVPGIATSHDHVPSGWGILWMVTVPGREAPPWAGS